MTKLAKTVQTGWMLCAKVFFFYLDFMACQDYFTNFEPSIDRCCENGRSRETPPEQSQAELGLSHIIDPS